MSRFVLTRVLLDFGSSLWSSQTVGVEHPGLASSGFQAVGKFGIGFFAVFILGKQVTVTTRRYRRSEGEQLSQLTLEFSDGLNERPVLRPATPNERLRQCGTRVSVRLTSGRLEPLIRKNRWRLQSNKNDDSESSHELLTQALRLTVERLCPASTVTIRVGTKSRLVDAVMPDDWQQLDNASLLSRTGYSRSDRLKLWPVFSEAGTMLARVAYTGNWRNTFYTSGYGASLTFKGVLVAKVHGIAGVLLAANNSDIKRELSHLEIPSSAWTTWAGQILSAGDLNIESLAALKALAPAYDVAVYRKGDAVYSEAQVREWLRTVQEIQVHEGVPTYDRDDECSERRFESHFEAAPELLILPSVPTGAERDQFSVLFGVEPIDYLQRLEDVVRAEWLEFDESDSYESVGAVDNEEIMRRVHVYFRKL